MAREVRTRPFTVTVQDPEHWDPFWRATAEADTSGGTCQDYVTARLWEVMRAAGQAYVDEHPDLFATGLD